jgi:signal transduction histidine kinase
MQKEFINRAAHELQNPIQIILGLSEVLYTKIKDTEKRNTNRACNILLFNLMVSV